MKRVRTSAEGFWRGGYNGNKAGLKKKKNVGHLVISASVFQEAVAELGDPGGGEGCGVGAVQGACDGVGLVSAAALRALRQRLRQIHSARVASPATAVPHSS